MTNQRDNPHEGERPDEVMDNGSRVDDSSHEKSKGIHTTSFLTSLPLLHFTKGSRAITLGMIVTVAAAVIGVTYELTTVVYERQIEVLKRDRDHLREVDQSLRDALRQIKDNYNRLLITKARPTPLLPGNGSTVVADSNDVVRFDWAAAQGSTNDRYIIEVRNISRPNSKTVRLNVLKNKGRLMNLPLSRLSPVLNSSTEYLWRVRAGELVKGELISQGPWSPYESFIVFPSIAKRISSTGVIRIGFNATFFGYFNVVGKDGGYTGFDQEFGEWLAKQIWLQLNSKRKGKKVKIKRIEYAWIKLLPAVRNYEADLIISSLTKMHQSEQDYPGVKFSKPYLDVHQVFISTEKGKDLFPRALNKSSVGVQRGTFNYKVAAAVSKQFGFRVVKLETYADIYRELGSGTIDFGLVDDVLVGPQLGSKFYQYGPVLDEYLTQLYNIQLGYDSEAYAVAVRDKGLLTIINNILDSKKAEDYLNSLKGKWVRSPKRTQSAR